MSEQTVFSESEYKVLLSLMNEGDNISVRDLSARLEIDQTFVSAASLVLSERGFITVSETSYTEIRIKDTGEKYASTSLPERQIARALQDAGGILEIKRVPEFSSLSPSEVGSNLRWLFKRGWAAKQKESLVLTPRGKDSFQKEDDDEKLLQLLSRKKTIRLDKLKEYGISSEKCIDYLKKREGIVSLHTRRDKYLFLTDKGKQLVNKGISPRISVTQLTSDLLISGKWREVDLQKYDVTKESLPIFQGKIHPFVKIQEETRTVFISMGFEEVTTSYVESSFWNFDALFTPQDHPAREMQDTFYVQSPSDCLVPTGALVDRIRKTHEDGGDTGSIGWCYKWDEKKARRPVLRTHTTSATIRALAANPAGPGKYFCIGPVFRRETIDYKHLPVFVQIDGIIVEENASLANLLGTLSEFYSKMGFEKYQFRPGFFPYTEPSVEIFVWNSVKNDWVEMGGAGIFRPEVTVPLGCTTPVLAWGLGLERIAMFRYGLSSIREIYSAALKWLQEVPSCL